MTTDLKTMMLEREPQAHRFLEGEITLSTG